MLRLIRNLIVILAVFLGLAFGYFNYGSTTVDLLWTRVEAPLAVLLGLAFLFGLLIGFIVCSVRMIKLRARLSRARHRIKEAETELSELRPPTHST